MANGNDPVNLTRQEWQEILGMITEIRSDVKNIIDQRKSCLNTFDKHEKRIGEIDSIVNQAKGGVKVVHFFIGIISALIGSGITIIIFK